MNTQSSDTITTNDLTIELRSADGTSTEFYQTDEDRIRKTLRQLTTPRLFTQPQLMLASEHSVSTIPCRSIDLILARTSGRSPLIFPLIFPAGLLDILELHDESPEAGFPATDHDHDVHSDGVSPLISRVEVYMSGGWRVVLRVLAIAGATVQDKRRSFAHLFDLPIIPFRLQEGGIGLINPNSITRVSARPTPDALPDTALPMDLLRRTPLRF